MTFRFTALIPVLASAIVIALNCVLLIEGSSARYAGDLYWLLFNTTNFGKNVVVISNLPVSGPSPTGSPFYSATPTSITGQLPSTTSPSATSSGFSIFDPLNPLNLSLPTMPSILLPTVLPTLPTLKGLPTAAILPGLSFEELADFPAFGSGTSTSIGLNLTYNFGGADQYNLYITNTCKGNLSYGDNPNGSVNITQCSSYATGNNELADLVNTLKVIPSSLTIGTLNITFPFISSLDRTWDRIIPFGDSISRAFLAFVVLRLTAGALAFVGSIVGAFNENICLPVVFNMLAFATLVNISLLIATTVVTGDMLGMVESIRSTGNTLGLEVQFGTSFIAIEWVAAACSLIGTTYWLLVWFVEHRTVAFSRRYRRPGDLGNWCGLLRELKRDWRGPSYDDLDDENAIASPATGRKVL